MAVDRYEINQLEKEESWRLFRIIGELVEGFDSLAGLSPAVTFYGSARLKPGTPVYEKTREIANLIGKEGFNIITGGGPGAMEAANLGAQEAGVKSAGLNIKLPRNRSAMLSPMLHCISITSSCVKSCWSSILRPS
jgi:predicted Rossmann-fold nucleotide-binding protein